MNQINVLFNQIMDNPLKELYSAISEHKTLGIILAIFTIIICWKVLEKAGERGWKQFIPIYNIYINYKLYWSTGMFWLTLFSPVIFFFLIILICGFNALSLLLSVVLIVLVVIILLSSIILEFKKANCFGQGFFFGLGLLIVPTVFVAILAFDPKCEYHR